MDFALHVDQMFDKGHQEQQLQLIEENGGHVARMNLLGRMTTSLVLDTRQPLSVIMTDCGAVQRLLASGSIHCGKIEFLLSHIIVCVQWADDVVSFADRMTGRRVATCMRVNLNALGKTAVQLVQCESFSRPVPINFDFSALLADVLGDELQLEQVMVTLLIYSLQEQAELTTEQRIVYLQTTDLDGEIVVSVGRILPPDTTVSQGSTRTLITAQNEVSMCQRIVEAHKGSLETFRYASGLMFQMTLPHFSMQPELCPPSCQTLIRDAASEMPLGSMSCH